MENQEQRKIIIIGDETVGLEAARQLASLTQSQNIEVVVDKEAAKRKELDKYDDVISERITKSFENLISSFDKVSSNTKRSKRRNNVEAKIEHCVKKCLKRRSKSKLSRKSKQKNRKK